jgi:hypothetical protein
MRRRLSVLAIGLIVLTTQLAIAQSWVSFNSVAPNAPKITLLESDDAHVAYQVVVPGMWVSTVEQDGKSYQLLNIDGAFVHTDSTGVPRLPVISTKIGISKNASLEVSMDTRHTQYLSGYMIAPVAVQTLVVKNGFTEVEMTYLCDSVTYAMTDYYPTVWHEEPEPGVAALQEIGEVDFCPVRFNPKDSTLEVADTVIITADFKGGGGSALVDMGPFNTITYQNVINSNISPYDLPHTLGSVTWVDANQTAIQCDYLIVIPDTAWTNLPRNHSTNPDQDFVAQVQRFAQLRASLSGYDVCIVRYGNSPTSVHPGLSDANYGSHAWEGLHDYLHQVWDNGHAHNTGTNHLGYVLIIGDARDEDSFADPFTMQVDDWLIPSPRSNLSNWGPDSKGSDHVYACLTHDAAGTFDQYEDVGLGRFPVGGPNELKHVVDKMFTYCVTPGDRSWHYRVLNLAGRTSEGNDTNCYAYPGRFFQRTTSVLVRRC